MAGEIGHAVVDPKGPLCKCGARGCLEAIASGPAIAVRAKEKLLATQGTLLTHPILCREGTLSSETVFKAALEGDELAIDTLTECERIPGFYLPIFSARLRSGNHHFEREVWPRAEIYYWV